MKYIAFRNFNGTFLGLPARRVAEMGAPILMGAVCTLEDDVERDLTELIDEVLQADQKLIDMADHLIDPALLLPRLVRITPDNLKDDLSFPTDYDKPYWRIICGEEEIEAFELIFGLKEEE